MIFFTVRVNYQPTTTIRTDIFRLKPLLHPMQYFICERKSVIAMKQQKKKNHISCAHIRLFGDFQKKKNVFGIFRNESEFISV